MFANYEPRSHIDPHVNYHNSKNKQIKKINSVNTDIQIII